MPTLFYSYFSGMIAAAGLIMAIGAQNAFVLAQGLRREHHVSVALICMTCDAILILAGTFGLAALLQAHPLAMEITRWGGVAFLTVYALQALLRALTPRGLEAMGAPSRSRRAVLLSTLAVTLLNPHVYLDTMVLIGSLAAQHSLPWFSPSARPAHPSCGSPCWHWARPAWLRYFTDRLPGAASTSQLLQ